jgi:regulator of protease activity HflC (stomatin/prohibitin superfamily)
MAAETETEIDTGPARGGTLKESGARYDPYWSVLLVLLVLATLGAAGAAVAAFEVPVSVDAFVILALSAGALAGTLVARSIRAAASREAPNGAEPDEASSAEPSAAEPDEPARDAEPDEVTPEESSCDEHNDEEPSDGEPDRATAARGSKKPAREKKKRFRGRKRALRSRAAALDAIRLWLPGLGLFAIALELIEPLDPTRHSTAFGTALVASSCLASAAVAAAAARYLTRVDATLLPEGAPLARAARVAAWLMVVTAAAIGAAWFGLPSVNRACHYTTLGVLTLACGAMLWRKFSGSRELTVFPLDLGVFSALGGRANVVASVLDAAERKLGIDLRSTWALNVMRRSAVPLVLGLGAMGWLSTSVSIVPLSERALVERFGVPLGGPALEPGLHWHWPWPVDRVIRVEAQRVRALKIGHKGELQTSGPENVLWARPHAKREYTFLLGNGRDLIAIGAVLQFRISDARAWHYGFADPTAALRAITYRAVLRATVSRTLDQALSENVGKLTAHIQASVQSHADALGLGVQVVSFTIHGMHPPMSVARAYQAVVSAQVGEVTAHADATSYENRTVPEAQADAIVAVDAARSKGATNLGQAVGEAWSFRTVEAQYKASPAEFRFRRRLETLEQGLSGRQYTIIEADILRDGGGLWLRP